MSTDREDADVRRGPLWFIARGSDGWYLVDLETCKKLSGPFREHADAVTNADARAYRVAQGWEP